MIANTEVVKFGYQCLNVLTADAESRIARCPK